MFVRFLPLLEGAQVFWQNKKIQKYWVLKKMQKKSLDPVFEESCCLLKVLVLMVSWSFELNESATWSQNTCFCCILILIVADGFGTFSELWLNLFVILHPAVHGPTTLFKHPLNTWRIIRVSKWLVTPIYKPFRWFGRGPTTLVRWLAITILSNHVSKSWDRPPSMAFWSF